MNNVLLNINFNDYPSTLHLIKNVLDYKVLDSIIVVDNCSTDDSYNKLNKIDGVTTIKTDSNKGYSYAINYGAKYAIKKYKDCNIIVSNADIIIDSEDDIKSLINVLDNDEVGVVAPVINEHGFISRGWKQPSPLIDSLLNIVFIHRFLRKKLLMYNQYKYELDTTEVEIMSGCFFIIKSTVLKEINFLDENVFLYYEENIIGKKLENINKKILIDNKVEIIHNHSVSINKSLSRIKKYKQLKKSQYYFQTVYNKANIFEGILLLLTNKLTLIILYIV